MFLSKGVVIRVNIRWDDTKYKGNGMIMDTIGGREALGVSKTNWCLVKRDWMSG
jgi:hypothetical protein